jgi:hypothetical protein
VSVTCVCVAEFDGFWAAPEVELWDWSRAWTAEATTLFVVERSVRSSKLSSLNAAARFRALIEEWRTRVRIFGVFDVARFIEVPFKKRNPG